MGFTAKEIISSEEKAGKTKTLSRKSILSQAIACTAQNLLLLDLGIATSFSTMIIAALLEADGELSFTKYQASWFGSVNFICQPVGSILSGFILEPLGRKKAMLVANVPHIIAYLMIFFAKDVATLFVAAGLLGFGTGFMEAPTLTYVGEISHPLVRGMLIVYSQIFLNFGIFLSYLLGTVLEWRVAAVSFIAIPVITFFAIMCVPESPVWLLSKNREEDARKALCWVRGWAKPNEVDEEFQELVEYQKNSAKCQICTNEKKDKVEVVNEDDCPHTNMTMKDKVKEHYRAMMRKEMLRPLAVMFLLFLFHALTGPKAIQPYMVNVYNSFGMNIDGHIATIITGAIGLCGVCTLLTIVHYFGKRPLNLISLGLSSIILLLLGTYAYIVLPEGTSSFNPEKTDVGPYSWIPTTLFILLNVVFYLGAAIIPWLMIAELFPLRGRGMACGIAAAYSYIVTFVVTKTYFNLETSLEIYGTMYLYSFCSALGCLLLYILMPETEGKPFTEIETKFSGDSMPIFANDRISRAIRRKFGKRDEPDKNTHNSPDPEKI